jgi:hypothetical protein
MAAAAGTAGMSGQGAGAMLKMIDMKNILRLEPFSGKKEEFETFKWEMYVALSILDSNLRRMLEVVEKERDRDFPLRSLMPDEQVTA